MSADLELKDPIREPPARLGILGFGSVASADCVRGSASPLDAGEGYTLNLTIADPLEASELFR